ncbi:MAG: class I SAM-dependent methyltransferase [Treponema sp.]|jgi:SAM-dependent methyltransferase|nr:class I SAM-dependent methyltransferase [Treponema sp.]
MVKNYFQHARKPQGMGGRLFVAGMNLGHMAISTWGLKQLTIKSQDVILDIGCGGGKNVLRMLKQARTGMVCGLDHAEICVEKTKKLNQKAVCQGRSDIRLGSVSHNPWPDNTFDVVTAFETVYFWPDLVKDLREVRRVLKPGGLFFICNELHPKEEGKTPYQYWIKLLDLQTYTDAEFQNMLSAAGFITIAIVSKGKNGMCLSARAQKEESEYGTEKI